MIEDCNIISIVLHTQILKQSVLKHASPRIPLNNVPNMSSFNLWIFMGDYGLICSVGIECHVKNRAIVFNTWPAPMETYTSSKAYKMPLHLLKRYFNEYVANKFCCVTQFLKFSCSNPCLHGKSPSSSNTGWKKIIHV